MTREDAELILMYAECDMNVSETAKRCYVHRNTVLYHFAKIEETTGLQPRKFYDLCRLLPMAREVLEEQA